MTDTLYTYRCRTCKTIAVAAFRRVGAEKCVRCNLCHSPMPLLWDDPVETDDQRALWNEGVVYNPAQWLEDRKKATA